MSSRKGWSARSSTKNMVFRTKNLLTGGKRGVRYRHVPGKNITLHTKGAASCILPGTRCSLRFSLQTYATGWRQLTVILALETRSEGENVQTGIKQSHPMPVWAAIDTATPRHRNRAWGWSGHRTQNPGRPHDSRTPVPSDGTRKVLRPDRPNRSFCYRAIPPITRTGQQPASAPLGPGPPVQRVTGVVLPIEGRGQ